MKAPRALLAAFALALACAAAAQTDPLPSWNEGPAKKAIVDFVQATTTPGSSQFVPSESRVATFDQDGTLWVEQPMYAQVLFALDRLKDIARSKPDLASAEPFKTVLTGDRKAIAALPMRDVLKVLAATLTGMTTEQYEADVRAWLATAKDPRWKRPYTELTYLPMQELMKYLRANGYRTYIVTGGEQDFVRVYSEATYGVPREHVVGTAATTRYAYDSKRNPVLVKVPKRLLDSNEAGKPEGIHLLIGRRPIAAFGNSTGDRQMLEYTKAGDGARLALLVLHDDAAREYAYGPANGLPPTRVGSFTQALYDEATKKGWVVVSIKSDWKRVFAFEP